MTEEKSKCENRRGLREVCYLATFVTGISGLIAAFLAFDQGPKELIGTSLIASAISFGILSLAVSKR